MSSRIANWCQKLLESEIIAGPMRSFLLYWEPYGGGKALLRSVYFIASFVLALSLSLFNHFCFSLNAQWEWWEDAISVIPSVLGFSLGGYAILVGFGDGKFLNIIQGKEKGDKFSLYMTVNATFLHFIFIQFISVLYTILIKATHLTGIWLFDFLGIWFFLYAVLTIISTSFCVLHLADWFDTMTEMDKHSDDKENK